jgi:uncharacterized membrane protein
MATFTVWKLPAADGAGETLDTLVRLQGQELIKIHDAAIVAWPEGRKKPKTRQLNSLVGVGALGGSKVREALPGLDAELIHTNLSEAEEARLREAFSEEA